MELRHLLYFATVAETLNFSRAAELVPVAQPSLSQQIRQLEAEWGVELFYRTQRRVQLTDAGRALLPEVQRLLAQAEHLKRLAAQARSGQIGRLEVGFVSSALSTTIPAMVRTFRTHYPHVALVLHELTTAQQVQHIQQGTLDVGFVRPPLEAALGSLILKLVWQEPLVVALPADHAAAHCEWLSLGSLANEPFILFPRQAAPSLWDQIIHACQRAGFTPHVAQEASPMPTILSLVAAGLGVALVPAALQQWQWGQIIYRPLALEDQTITELAVIYNPTAPSAVLAAFLSVVHQFRSLDDAAEDASSRDWP